MIKRYDQFLVENVFDSIEKDLENVISDLDIENPSEIQAASFLKAFLSHDGNVKAIKDKDIAEGINNVLSLYNDDSLNESETIHMIALAGEILGSLAALEYIVNVVCDRIGKKRDVSNVKHKVHNFFKWIDVTDKSSIVYKVLNFIMRLVGLKGPKLDISSKMCTVIFLIVLLVAGLAVFPLTGGASSALAVASIASVAKTREIWVIAKDIWNEIKNPTDSDISKNKEFYSAVASAGSNDPALQDMISKVA